KDLGYETEAENIAKKAISYSAHVGDHRRIWSAECFLADCALKRGDGVKALKHIGESAREWIQEKVGLGYRAGHGGEMLSMADGALNSVALGADAISAVMIVESLKAATTASSLIKGMPIQPLKQKGQASNNRLKGLEKQ